ncbi:hypothetical protein DRQ29_02225 [bacterium]|nr:DUF4321 domain-containing protein [bacterium]RKZ28214.1 MAG: hypothetical protein DRQ29_02225 [bacterium]
MTSKKFWTFVIAIISGIISGSLVSELLKMILPTGVVKNFLTYSINFGIEPPFTINLAVVKLSFGFAVSFTVISLLFLILIIYYFKWWL